jgi:hypothetical protein
MRDLAFDHWDDLLKMVLEENNRQLDKWGYQDHDAFYWMVFLTEEVGELAAEIADSHWDRGDATDATVAMEAIQVATLALKIAEMHLYRRQSEAPDDVLINPSVEDLKASIEAAPPGSTITIEEDIHPRFREEAVNRTAEIMTQKLEKHIAEKRREEADRRLGNER